MRRSQHAECVFPWRSTGSHGRDIGKQNRAKEEDREQPTTIHAKYPGCAEGLNQLYVLLQEKARARAMSGLGEAAADQGDIDSAARYFEECIELDRTLGDTASTLGEPRLGLAPPGRAPRGYCPSSRGVAVEGASNVR